MPEGAKPLRLSVSQVSLGAQTPGRLGLVALSGGEGFAYPLVEVRFGQLERERLNKFLGVPFEPVGDGSGILFDLGTAACLDRLGGGYERGVWPALLYLLQHLLPASARVVAVVETRAAGWTLSEGAPEEHAAVLGANTRLAQFSGVTA